MNVPIIHGTTPDIPELYRNITQIYHEKLEEKHGKEYKCELCLIKR